ncbi:hypothetical protein M8494_12020 [Serratia ureilytica]
MISAHSDKRQDTTVERKAIDVNMEGGALDERHRPDQSGDGETGATFGELSPRRQTIEHVDAAALVRCRKDAHRDISWPPDNAVRDTRRSLVTPSIYAGQYLWLYENFTKNSPLYNIPIAKEIPGPLNPRVCSPR